MTGEPVTAQEAEQELNIIERLVSGASSTDEYLEAIVRNQRLTAELIMQSNGVRGSADTVLGDIDIDDLPVGLAGSAVSSIPANDEGRAVFNISGNNVVARVEPSSQVDRNEIVVVNGRGNVVRPAPNSEDALSTIVGSGTGTLQSAMSATSYSAYETADLADNGYPSLDTDDGALTLQPGDRAPLVSSGELNDGGALLALGASDAEDVRYYLEVDGEVAGEGTTNSPLGAINDQFSFVDKLGKGIAAANNVEYWAIYDEDAQGPVDLAARMHIEEA